VEPEALDYPEALAWLTAILGRRVEVTLRGKAIGWDLDAFRLEIGDARITLHPDLFVERFTRQRRTVAG